MLRLRSASVHARFLAYSASMCFFLRSSRCLRVLPSSPPLTRRPLQIVSMRKCILLLFETRAGAQTDSVSCRLGKYLKTFTLIERKGCSETNDYWPRGSPTQTDFIRDWSNPVNLDEPYFIEFQASFFFAFPCALWISERRDAWHSLSTESTQILWGLHVCGASFSPACPQ